VELPHNRHRKTARQILSKPDTMRTRPLDVKCATLTFPIWPPAERSKASSHTVLICCFSLRVKILELPARMKSILGFRSANPLSSMAETKHCHCFECNAYVPPGYLYSHWCDAHEDLTWNDHAVAWTDMQDVKKAMPWFREEEEEKRRKQAEESLWN
jgi:hypothetical protein